MKWKWWCHLQKPTRAVVFRVTEERGKKSLLGFKFLLQPGRNQVERKWNKCRKTFRNPGGQLDSICKTGWRESSFPSEQEEKFQNAFGEKMNIEFLSGLDLWLFKSDPLETWRNLNFVGGKCIFSVNIYAITLCSVFCVISCLSQFSVLCFHEFKEFNNFECYIFISAGTALVKPLPWMKWKWW